MGKRQRRSGIDSRNCDESSTRTCPLRRGSTQIMVAASLFFVIGMAALAIEMGNVNGIKTELQTGADTISLAAASGLPDGQDEVWARANDFAAKNSANGAPLDLQPADLEFGGWDPETRTFTPGVPTPDAVRVNLSLSEARANAVPLRFARVLGYPNAEVGASSIAVFRSRDIVVVLDLSASMAYDSSFLRISSIGQAAIEQNLFDIWTELGSPTFGNMEWEPRFIDSTDPVVVLEELELTDVPYPYPQGSWEEYVWYVSSFFVLKVIRICTAI